MGVTDRQAATQILEQCDAVVTGQPLAGGLNIMDAGGKRRFGDQRDAIDAAHASVFRNRWSRCSGCAPILSIWRRLAALTSAIQVMPSRR